MARSSQYAPWKISLHGGHSRRYCDHAPDTLEDILDAAAAFGYHTYGVTEHAPRLEPHRLYDEEKAMGWTVDTLWERFEEYAAQLDRLAERYADRLQLLKGFEAEVVPENRYAEIMLELKNHFQFEYIVGSVHWVGGHIIDYRPSDYEKAVQACGGIENMAVRYYQTVAEMVQALQPEIVGHLDVLCCRAPSEDAVSTPRVREAAFDALEVIQRAGAILDLNTGGYRKNLGRPMPAPWLVSAAHAMGIPFCFGDDAHRVAHVGAGLDDARKYLLDLGIDTITALSKDAKGHIGKTKISLLPSD